MNGRAHGFNPPKKGDREAFDALVDLHGRAVLRFLDGLCGSHADAEDLAQETLFIAFRKLATFQRGGHFRAWLLTIAYHEWVHGKRKKRRMSLKDQEELSALPAPADAMPACEREELAEDLRHGLSGLPEEQRVVVLLRFGEGLAHEEIAELTKTEPATVRWRLYRRRSSSCAKGKAA